MTEPRSPTKTVSERQFAHYWAMATIWKLPIRTTVLVLLCPHWLQNRVMDFHSQGVYRKRGQECLSYSRCPLQAGGLDGPPERLAPSLSGWLTVVQHLCWAHFPFNTCYSSSFLAFVSYGQPVGLILIKQQIGFKDQLGEIDLLTIVHPFMNMVYNSFLLVSFSVFFLE